MCNQSTMDKTTVANLSKKFLDCVKLLISEQWPDDLPEVLNDIIYNTKLLADKIKSHQPKSKDDGHQKSSLNTEPEYKLNVLKGLKYNEYNPVVRIKRLKMEHEKCDKEVDSKPKKARKAKETLDNENSQSINEDKTKFVKKNPKTKSGIRNSQSINEDKTEFDKKNPKTKSGFVCVAS